MRVHVPLVIYARLRVLYGHVERGCSSGWWIHRGVYNYPCDPQVLVSTSRTAMTRTLETLLDFEYLPFRTDVMVVSVQVWMGPRPVLSGMLLETCVLSCIIDGALHPV